MTDNLDDFVTYMHKQSDEWDKKHPVHVWIDKLFKDKSIAGYRASHSITHPWLIVDELARQVKWAWQRVFKGWDDRVIWSVDWHIAKMLPIWMRELKKYGHGTPSCLFTDADEYTDETGTICIKPESEVRASKEWDDILENVALGFESYLKMNDLMDWRLPEYKIEEEKFNKGFELLKTWFGSFWD
jgi:hypothetical protein